MKPNQTTASFSILITVDEWRAIADWMNTSLLRNENSPQGHFLLECHGTSRTWIASDGDQTTIHRCDGPAPQGLDDPDAGCALLVNSRFFRRNNPQDAVLTVTAGEEGRLQTFETDGIRMTLPEHPGEFLDWRAVRAGVLGDPFEVDVDALSDACAAASIVPFGVGTDDTIHTWAWVESGTLRLLSPWLEYPRSELSVHIEGAVPDTTPVLLDIGRLITLLSPIRDSQCTVRLPQSDPMGCVGVSAGDYEAILSPTDRWGAERELVEALLCDFLGVDSIDADEDGDYPVETPEGHQLWVRLHTAAEPVTVQVFSVLAQPVEPSSGLFEELNSINATAPHVKVLWASGAVMAEVDLVGSTLDLPELRNALQVVRRTADKYYDVLNAFFGAPAIGDSDEI